MQTEKFTEEDMSAYDTGALSKQIKSWKMSWV